MPPLLPESEAGPSKKRVSTFKSNSDGESSGYEDEEPIIKRKKSKLNGNGNGYGNGNVKRQKLDTPNGHGNEHGIKVEEKRRKLKERAGELLEMRQDLPFYQGTHCVFLP